MNVVVFSDYVTCSQCKKARAALASFAGWCADNGVAYIPADRSANPNLYSACKNQFKWAGGSFPQVYVVDDKLKTVLRFVARGMTLAKLTAKVKPYCAGCSDGTVATPKPEAVKPVKKPAKRKRWFTIVITGLSLALLSGCVWTSGTFKPAATVEVTNPAQVSIRRIAFLYPFAIADVAYHAGEFKMGSYQTSGGATELVPLVDSSGKLVGSFIGTAAKAAVVP